VQVFFDSDKCIEQTIGAPQRAVEQFALSLKHAVDSLCPGLFLLQVVSDSNKRIEHTVGEARRAAEQFDTGFDVAKALVNISQVAAVQQGDLAKQVALVARQVAANPDVEDAAVRAELTNLTEVRTC
jgi:hypothetical protein